MNVLRRSLGIVPLLLGSIGLLVCIAVGVGLWILGERIDRMNQMLFSQSDYLFEIADRQMQRAAVGLNDANDLLLTAELGLTEEFDEAVVRKFLARPEVQSMELKLRSAITEVESLIHVIETSEELIRQGKNSLNFSSEAGQNIEGTFLETLGKTRLALMRLLRAVSDAQACWLSLNQGRDLENNAKNLLRMNNHIQRQLEEVSSSVTNLRDKLANERKAWQELGSTSTRYIGLGQYIGVGIIAWIGLGQYALALCGVMRLRCRIAKDTTPQSV